MSERVWKVGELSKVTGVTVRTLHYYDEIGLLTPSCHTESGHRLYQASDVARLQQIKSLQQLGFTLEETAKCLNDIDCSPSAIIRMHRHRLEKQIALEQQLLSRLTKIEKKIYAMEEVSVDEFLSTIKEITMTEMFEQYYTPEQLEELKKREQEVGEERILAVQQEWPKLIAEVQAEMDKGTDPSDEKVQALAKRWMGLIQEFTGGNPEIEKSLNNMYQNEPEMAKQQGFDPALFEYIQKAMLPAD